MKLFKTVLIVFLVIVVVLVAAALIFLSTFDANKYKPQITSQISKLLGRDVGIENLKLFFSLGQGIALNIKGLRIADQPDFSKEDFLTIENINIGVDVAPFLHTRSLVVSSVTIDSPKITIIRNENNEFNVQKFAAPQNSAGLDTAPNFDVGLTNLPESGLVYAAETNPSMPNTFSLPSLSVRSLIVENANIVFIDKSFKPEMIIEMAPVAVQINDFSLDKPFSFSLSAAMWSRQKNMRVDGVAAIDTAHASTKLSNVKFSSNLSDISLPEFYRSFAAIEGVDLLKGLQGKVESTISQADIDAGGLKTLLLDGKMSDGKIILGPVILPLEPVNALFHATEKDIILEEVSVGLGKGKITGRGSVKDYLGGQAFDFSGTLEGIDLTEVVAQQDQPMQMQGKLFGQFSVSGKGLAAGGPSAESPAGESMIDSLIGGGNIQIKQGVLTNINVLKLILSKMSMLPNLVENVEQTIPEKYKNQLESNDTIFNKIELITKIENGALTIENADVETDAFNLSGQGRVSFNQTVDLTTSLVIPEDLSASMTSGVEGLRYLLSDDNKIVIPVAVSGKIPDLAFMPDLEYLGKRIIVNRGFEELDKALDKVFGTEGSSDNPSPEGQPQEKSPERELLEGIFDKVFR